MLSEDKHSDNTTSYTEKIKANFLVTSRAYNEFILILRSIT